MYAADTSPLIHNMMSSYPFREVIFDRVLNQAIEHDQPAVLAAINRFLEQPEATFIAVWISHHKRFLDLLRRGDHGIRFGQAIGDRFFEKNVTTGLQTLHRDLVMQVMRNQDEDAINVLETVAVIGERANTRLTCQNLRPLLIRISQPGDLGLAAQFAQSQDMEGSDPAAAYESDLVGSHRSLPG
jgi:hypothetical protein